MYRDEHREQHRAQQDVELEVAIGGDEFLEVKGGAVGPRHATQEVRLRRLSEALF